MKVRIFYLVFCVSFSLLSQKPKNFGKLTQKEMDYVGYEKDTTANAVYLYEKGDNYFQVRGDYIRLITKYHAKIKILKQDGFDQSVISIPYYHNSNAREKVWHIKAITHNGTLKRFLKEENIFDVDRTERWSEKKFTFPDVQVGSVLEYSYEIESPFYFNLNGWEFQSDIPKVYTEYNAKIPGNWTYNRTLKGYLPLNVNEATIDKSCFEISALRTAADCEVLKYAMKDVPAFKESEAFMLSGDNYKSNLKFELSQYQDFQGRIKKYTKSWKDVDKEFRTDPDIGKQLRKKNFFEKKVPLALFPDGTPLEKATTIYKYVQKHFSWNGKYGLWRDNRVKKAFEEHQGSVAEINITLINLLNAAGFKTDLVLLSTREHGMPHQNHPVMSDFNYIVAKTTIDGKDYLLDASEDVIPFGTLPYRCLNYYGRVMDFENESYWYNITPQKKNTHTIRGSLSFDLSEELASGNLLDVSIGYESITQKRKIENSSKEDYVKEIEEKFGPDLYIEDHFIKEKLTNDNKLTQQFRFEIEDVLQDDMVYLNPFLRKFFPTNPFKADERNYPIDFGYPREYGYFLSIEVPEGYQVKNLPEKVGLKLPQNSGVLFFDCKEELGKVTVFFQFRINGVQFAKESYDMVKTIFGKAVDVQNQSLVVFKKT